MVMVMKNSEGCLLKCSVEHMNSVHDVHVTVSLSSVITPQFNLFIPQMICSHL